MNAQVSAKRNGPLRILSQRRSRSRHDLRRWLKGHRIGIEIPAAFGGIIWIDSVRTRERSNLTIEKLARLDDFGDELTFLIFKNLKLRRQIGEPNFEAHEIVSDGGHFQAFAISESDRFSMTGF
jgi:site-specific DNA-cytosine methylase